jgi:HEPN domain-containing protein
MINIEKQIEYWRNSSASDFGTARVLLENGKYNEGLFFCHLAVEKILKALFVKHTGELAPKIHKLQYIAEKSNTELSEKQKEFFGY